jgi:phosphoglycolate phosphatase-like HAD superfamily hydrolase
LPITDIVINAVAFDLDGVLIDSEPTWTEVRREFVLAHGGAWPDGADRRMMGMATAEWAHYLHDELGVAHRGTQIAEGVIDQMAARLSPRHRRPAPWRSRRRRAGRTADGRERRVHAVVDRATHVHPSNGRERTLQRATSV